MWHSHLGEVSTLTISTPIFGTCDDNFVAVREAFIKNFVLHNEIGASVCVTVNGRNVVDLWGGYSDTAKQRPWQPDQLVNVFSVGKGITALLAAQCVDRGELRYDQLMTEIWPEFGCHGKEKLRVRDVLGHKAGLPAIRHTLSPTSKYDWQLMTTALAAEEPWWELDDRHGYHVNTFGFLVGELLRRVTGKTVGQLLRERVSQPLEADVYLNVPPTNHHRIAEFDWPYPPAEPADTSAFTHDQLLQYNTYYNPPGMSGSGTVNTSEWRQAEIPSTNMHASGRGVCAVYTDLAATFSHRNNVLISSNTLSEAVSEVSLGQDLVLQRESRFAHGFQIPIPERGFGPNEQAFGHYGAGGSVGFADPTAGVGFGYVMNQMGPRWQNPRNRALIEALYQCI